MKTVYVRNIISDIWRQKKGVAVFIVICVIAAVFLALRPGSPVNLSDEQKEELDAYNAQVEEYDTAIADLEKSIDENIKQVEELREYVDHSIYMKLDSQNIQTAAVQYGLQTEGNVGNTLNSFITYINDGGLRESVPEEDQDLQPEYWRDVISCYINSNILNVTVIHYDAEKCARIMEIVKKRIREHEPEVAAAQGQFTLTEMESTQFVKADTGIMNGQNGNLNNLKNYESGLADLRNRLVNYRTNRKNYIEANEPSFAPSDKEEDKNSRVIRYLIAGIVIGAIAACAAVALRYILSDRLRSAEELSNSGLNVLGTCRAGRKKKDGGDPKKGYSPEPARTVMDVRILAEAQKKDRVFLDLLHEDDLCGAAAETYRSALAESGLPAETGSRLMESADELKKMTEAGCCLLVLEAGKTTYQVLKSHMELCERFRVAVLGCVVIE